MQRSRDTQGSRSSVRERQKSELLESPNLRGPARRSNDRTIECFELQARGHESMDAQRFFHGNRPSRGRNIIRITKQNILAHCCLNPYVSCMGRPSPCRGINDAKMGYPQHVFRNDSPQIVVGPIICDNHFPRPWPMLIGKGAQSLVNCADSITARNDDAECHDSPTSRSSTNMVKERLLPVLPSPGTAESTRGSANRGGRAVPKSWDHSAEH